MPSSYTRIKQIENERENKVLLQKMLKIMGRPKKSVATFHEFHLTSRSNKSGSKMLKSNSQRSIRSGSQSPTSGIGHATLNSNFRRKESQDIKRQNLQIVNSLLKVKPNVPIRKDLRKWSKT